MFVGLCVCILFEYVATVSSGRTETAIHKKHSPEKVGSKLTTNWLHM